MRRTKILNLKHFNLINGFAKNKILFLLCLFLILGIGVGCISYSKSVNAVNAAQFFYKLYFLPKVNNSVWSVIFKSFSLLTCVAAVFFVFGTSMMGIVAIPFCTFCVGFISGDFAALMYSNYAVKGIAFNAVIFMPAALIFLVSLISVSKHSVNFSLSLTRLTFVKTGAKNLSDDFKFYCGKYLVFLALVLCAAITDGILNKFFLHFFGF